MQKSPIETSNKQSCESHRQCKSLTQTNKTVTCFKQYYKCAKKKTSIKVYSVRNVDRQNRHTIPK